MKRLIQFLRRYLRKHPSYVFTYFLFFWQKGFIMNAPLLNDSEITGAVKAGKSIIRFGDGEINILLSIKNHYQDFSPRLQKMLNEIVSNYNSKTSYILGVPRFINTSNQDLKNIGKLQVWLPLKIVFWLYFNKKTPYMDAHNFYYDNYFERVVVPEILDKDIIIVTRKETIDRIKQNKKLPWKNIAYIETPENNALGEYENIKNSIDKVLNNYNKSNVVLLFAMGPVGKYLIYGYANSGVQSIDLGKAVEVMFTDVSISYLI